MPSVKINLNSLLNLEDNTSSHVQINTPLGNMLLEIQGSLELPAMESEVAKNDTEEIFTRYQDQCIMRIGLLSYDIDKLTATLIIGQNQRFLGNIVKLNAPLGILHFDQDNKKIDLQDVIKYKIIFDSRPLQML